MHVMIIVATIFQSVTTQVRVRVQVIVRIVKLQAHVIAKMDVFGTQINVITPVQHVMGFFVVYVTLQLHAIVKMDVFGIRMLITVTTPAHVLQTIAVPVIPPLRVIQKMDVFGISIAVTTAASHAMAPRVLLATHPLPVLETMRAIGTQISDTVSIPALRAVRTTATRALHKVHALLSRTAIGGQAAITLVQAVTAIVAVRVAPQLHAILYMTAFGIPPRVIT